MKPKKLLILTISYLLLCTTFPVTSANASTSSQPKTRAGLMSAVKHLYPWSFTKSKNCNRIMSKDSVIRRGIADVGIGEYNPGYGCAGGFGQIWAYTGTKWLPLSVGMQNTTYYLTKIPGKIDICKGEKFTNIRSGPSLSAKIVGKVTSSTTSYASRVLLTQQSFEPASSSSTSPKRDGLAWYQISWKGRQAWVASNRTIDPKYGCKSWTAGPVLGY